MSIVPIILKKHVQSHDREIKFEKLGMSTIIWNKATNTSSLWRIRWNWLPSFIVFQTNLYWPLNPLKLIILSEFFVCIVIQVSGIFHVLAVRFVVPDLMKFPLFCVKTSLLLLWLSWTKMNWPFFNKVPEIFFATVCHFLSRSSLFMKKLMKSATAALYFNSTRIISEEVTCFCDND